MIETLLIERISPADIPELIDIATEGNLSPWSANDYEQELRRGDSVMAVARVIDTDAIAGFIVGRRIPGLEHGADAEIYNIGVRSQDRLCGYGRELITYFINDCVYHSVQRVWLDVRVGNSGAIAFYKTFGFLSAYSRPNFYTAPIEDALVMRLTLSELRQQP